MNSTLNTSHPQRTVFGLDRLLSDEALQRELRGRRVALLAHPASVTPELDHALDALAKASESQDEIDPLGCMRQLLIHLFRQVAIDPKTRRINEILFHKCEFTDEMCDLRAQRQMAMLDCNSRIELALSNAIHRQQLPENLDVRRAAICLHAYIDGILGQWLLVPDSFELYKEAESWVDTGLDMLRLSPTLRISANIREGV